MNKLWDLKERQHRNCFQQKYQEVQAFKMFNDTLLNIFKVLFQHKINEIIYSPL